MNDKQFPEHDDGPLLGRTLNDYFAEMFHEAYERLAPAHEYQTRLGSRVPWSEVPEPNKSLMRAVMQELRDSGHLVAPYPGKTAPDDVCALHPNVTLVSGSCSTCAALSARAQHPQGANRREQAAEAMEDALRTISALGDRKVKARRLAEVLDANGLLGGDEEPKTRPCDLCGSTHTRALCGECGALSERSLAEGVAALAHDYEQDADVPNHVSESLMEVLGKPGDLPSWCTCPDDCDCEGLLVCGVRAGNTHATCDLPAGHQGWHVHGGHAWSGGVGTK